MPVVFPNDIYSKTRRGGKMTDADKAKVAIGAVLAAIAGTIVMTSGLWGSVGIPMVVIVLVGIALWVFVSVQIFRFLIFREQDRDLEESDLFAPYYKLRPGSECVKSAAGEFDMYELKNSSYMSAVQIRMGRNDGERGEKTKAFFDQLQDMLHVNGLGHTLVVMREDFLESREAAYMLENVGKVKEPQLRASLLSIYNEVFSFAEERGSVMCYYLLVYAPSSFQKGELEDAMVQIMTLFRKTKHLHALRSVEFLDEKRLSAFFRRFYGMGAIDLSLSKVQLNTMDTDVLKSITIFRIISKNGKSYGNPVLDKIATNVKYL